VHSRLGLKPARQSDGEPPWLRQVALYLGIVVLVRLCAVNVASIREAVPLDVSNQVKDESEVEGVGGDEISRAFGKET